MKQITGYTKLLGVIANPIKHSLSPKMHNAACEKLGLDYVYVAFEVEKEEFSKAVAGLKAINIAGFNISMPYKQAIISHLDSISTRAKLCGAVNTVVNKDGKFYGDITDGSGFMQGLSDKGWELKGKKMTILGAGGAALAIIVQAALDGVSSIVVYKRLNPSFARVQAQIDTINEELGSDIILKPLQDLDALKKDIQESYILVNGTSVGMGELEGQSCIPDNSYFHSNLKVADVIYQPTETALLKQAKEAGLEYINGERMIVFQGACAFEQWTNQKMPISYVKEVLGLK